VHAPSHVLEHNCLLFEFFLALGWSFAAEKIVAGVLIQILQSDVFDGYADELIDEKFSALATAKTVC
ncbi:MAG: hypothetical protein AAB658_20210, partial [Chloroflexota bacterium]